MRLTTVSLTLTLAFAFLASAAPAPAPQEETAEQEACINKCLKTEEDCLLESISMSQCVIDFDTCHQICFPEQHLTGGPGPATLPAAPGTGTPGTGAPGTEDGNGPKKHKDVTDLDVTDNDGDDNDEDDYEGDQDDNEELGIAVGAADGGGETKALHGKGKGNGRSGVKAAAKEAEALTLTPEEINRMQQAYEDVYDESIISAPAGGEDAAEFDDDPSDY